MSATKTIGLLYGKSGLEVSVPATATVLAGSAPKAATDPARAVREALARPIGAPPLAEILRSKRPKTVAITISDGTRPVPNLDFLPPILARINAAGVDDSSIVIIIGTGMHRPSTDAERRRLVGEDILDRIEVTDHRADDPATLTSVSEDPPVKVCRRFAEADFRIVTGLIEPHFMAGFSGGRKGVCPALVDLETVQRFHGYRTLADPAAEGGLLEGNPCHRIALEVARKVGVDFLLNVAITADRRIAGVYCGDLEEAHAAGCRDVAEWTGAEIDAPFDLVVTCGGGYPLDETFYQTVKGMCTAINALGEHSTLLQVSDCGEGVGSDAYTEMMLRYDNDWRAFLADIEAAAPATSLDQWEYQMQARVLARIGRRKLWFASDGLAREIQNHLSVTPLTGAGDARQRAQRAIDQYIAAAPGARIAVIPEGPYTLLRTR